MIRAHSFEVSHLRKTGIVETAYLVILFHRLLMLFLDGFLGWFFLVDNRLSAITAGPLGCAAFHAGTFWMER